MYGAKSKPRFAKFLLVEGEPLSMSAEESLIQRALDGDGRAFADLVSPYLPMLHRIATRISGNPTLAEDAVQECLSIFFRNLKNYEPDTSLRTFLASIATKRAQTLIRGERRRVKREQKGRLFNETPPSPYEHQKEGETVSVLREALVTMPEKRRRVVLMRLDAGLSYGEIAAELKSTEGSVRVLAHLAMKSLKAALKAHEEGQ